MVCGLLPFQATCASLKSAEANFDLSTNASPACLRAKSRKQGASQSNSKVDMSFLKIPSADGSLSNTSGS